MRLSASQISSFRDCKRKWAWKALAGIQAPSSPAAELGGAVHKELERYFEGGTIDYTTKAGNIAATALAHVPKQGTPGLQTESEFHFEGPSGNTYLGFIDLSIPASANTGKFGMPIDVIVDYKTTSDFRWQKSADDLRSDVQSSIYAANYFREHPDAEGVELRWVYMLTRDVRKSAVSSIVVTPEEVWESFQKIENTAREMASITTKNPLDLPPTVEHCSAYGGCPYQGHCNLSPFEKIRSAAAQASARATALTTPTTPATPEVPLSSLLARLKANQAAQPTVITPGAVAAPVPTAPVPTAPVPTAPAPVAAIHPVHAATLLEMARGGPAAQVVGDRVVVPAAINPPEWQPAPTAEARAEAAPAAPAKRGPGRPRKVDSAAAPVVTPVVQVASPAVVHQAAHVPAVPVVQAAPPASETGRIRTLYVNCAPNVTYTDASLFILAAKAKIAATGLADYRFADYGKGPGMLAVATAAEVDAAGRVENLVVDSTTPEGSAVLMDLVARAQVVVR